MPADASADTAADPAGSDAALRSRANVLRVVTITMSAQAATALMALTPPVVIVAAAASFGVEARLIGFFAAILFGSAMLSSAAGGGLIARFGPVRTTQLCLLCASTGLVLLTFASVPVAIVSAVLLGIGYGPSTPASSHLLAPAATPRWRPLLFSVKQSAVPIGGAITGVLTPALIGWWDWRTSIFILSTAGVTVAVLLQPSRARYDAERARGARLRLDIVPAVRSAFAEPGLRRVALMAFAFSATQLCFNTYFVTFQVQQLGFTLVEAGFVYSSALMASVGFRVLWGAIAGGRVPGLRLLAVLSIAMACVCALTLAIQPGWPLWAMIVVGIAFASCAVSWNGVLLAAVVEASSVEASGAATGGVAFFIFAGMMLGPGVFGLLVAFGVAYSVAFTMVGALALAAGLPGMFAPRRAAEAET